MHILEGVLLSFTLSLDALTAAFAYGASKIKIPLKSIAIIDIVCTLTLVVTFYLGRLIEPYVSAEVIKYIAFAMLLIIGLTKLFDELIKYILKKKSKDEIQFKMFGFRFILNIYKNETTADADQNKILSVPEAVSLAVALSIDSLAAGFSAGLVNILPAVLFTGSLVFGMGALYLGTFLGKKVAKRTKINLAWLSGLILIFLAISKLF